MTERLTTGPRFRFGGGDLPLAELDPRLLYLQGAAGYTDYPVTEAS